MVVDTEEEEHEWASDKEFMHPPFTVAYSFHRFCHCSPLRLCRRSFISAHHLFVSVQIFCHNFKLPFNPAPPWNHHLQPHLPSIISAATQQIDLHDLLRASAAATSLQQHRQPPSIVVLTQFHRAQRTTPHHLLSPAEIQSRRPSMFNSDLPL
ncbi:unnamed protein product [Vicia faba]|uniref:Uncharacterized protein n=1 Tax=Vicia faba TaxID=3906 RepID=A0AAV0ZTX3_VICFA|nr:unnamed protein product [Vicia faba]